MPVRILEDWSRYEFVPGKSGERVFTIDGSVDGTTALTETDAQLQLALKTGVTYRAGFPQDSSLVVPEGGIHPKKIVPGLFEVTVRYDPLNRQNWTTGGGGSLLSRKWRIMVPELVEEDEPSDATYDGQANLNSNRDLFGDPVTRRSRYYRLRLRRFENPDDLFEKMLLYSNKWNLEDVTLPKYGLARKGELLIESILEVEPTIAKPGVVDVEYTLLARPTRRINLVGGGVFDVPSFWSRRMDLGRRASAVGPGSPTVVSLPITTKAGTGVDAYKQAGIDVRLDGRGRPINTDAYDVASEAGNVFVLQPRSPLNSDSVKTEQGPADPEFAGRPLAVFIWRDETNGPISFAPLNFGANN